MQNLGGKQSVLWAIGKIIVNEPVPLKSSNAPEVAQA